MEKLFILSEAKMKKEMTRFLEVKDVEVSLANTPQITFEITDACNLNCDYCGYGKFDHVLISGFGDGD